MRIAHPRSPVRRIVAGLLLAAVCAPAQVWAEDQPAEPTEGAPAADAPEASDDTSEESEEAVPVAVEDHWYTPVMHNFDIGFDLLIVRPLAAVTTAAGAVLFIPAAILTSPNGWDSMKEAYERFVREPGEYFATRPLGEF